MQPHSTEIVSADCCIVGAGPAGLMLGYLFARAGLRVVVIEKHPDFLRDFRGDTVHPSTLEIMHHLGLLEEFLHLPHQRAEKLQTEIDGQQVTMADFSRLPVQCRFIAFMPQWEFLHFLATKSAQFAGFTLMHSTLFSDFIYNNETICGVTAVSANSLVKIRARLVIGADGRHSAVREKAGLSSQVFGTSRDVIWFKLSKQATDPEWGTGHNGPRHNLILIDRGDYWQCGYSIPKGEFATLQKAGLMALKQNIAAVAPFNEKRMAELADWDQLKLLSIRIDRLDKWMKAGLLCIGDAAHAMSPVGGVGVNLAIQDAVATANYLTTPLLQGEVRMSDLEKVQKRRQFPTVATQFLQIKMSSKKGQSQGKSKMPTLIQRLPFLRFVFGRLIGLGFRTEKPQRFN